MVVTNAMGRWRRPFIRMYVYQLVSSLVCVDDPLPLLMRSQGIKLLRN